MTYIQSSSHNSAEKKPQNVLLSFAVPVTNRDVSGY